MKKSYTIVAIAFAALFLSACAGKVVNQTPPQWDENNG